MSTPTITISKIEYQNLKLQSKSYKKIMSNFFELAVKNQLSQVIDDFQKTNLYSGEFIQDLESGLEKSSYLKHYGDKANKKRSKNLS